MADNLGFSIDVPSGNELVSKILKNTNNFDSIQIFFDSHNLTKKYLENIKKCISKFKFIFTHSSYQINIGSSYLIDNSDSFYNSSLELILKEINYSYSVKSNGIILHTGKNSGLKYNNDIVYNNMITFILQLFATKVVKKDFLIIIETCSGQGGEMLANLKDFVTFILSFKNYNFYNNIAVCIDTCHIFQAGYDLNKDKTIKSLHKLFNKIKNKIKLIHLNDSFNPTGKRIDRHANIGEGYIKTKNLIKFIKPYNILNVPMIFEVSNIFSSYDNLHKN